MERKILEQASEQGIISQQQVESLLRFFTETEATESSNSEEQLRFIRSFGDVFITLGVIFVTIAIAQIGFSGYFSIIPLLLVLAATEWLVRIRRLSLPGIALLVAVVYFSSQFIGLSEDEFGLMNIIIPTGVALLFYWRYKMPFTLLPIALGMIGIVSVLLDIGASEIQSASVFYGLAVFSVAMWFDSRDVARKTRFSDSAFWLHLLAAPMVVHGVMVSLLVETASLPYRELLVILFFIVFFLVALYVDRRAILVSSVCYAIYAIVELAKNNEIQIENMTLLIFIGFGVFIIVLGVYWYKIRAVLFKKLNDASLSRYVPAIIR